MSAVAVVAVDGVDCCCVALVGEKRRDDDAWRATSIDCAETVADIPFHHHACACCDWRSYCCRSHNRRSYFVAVETDSSHCEIAVRGSGDDGPSIAYCVVVEAAVNCCC